MALITPSIKQQRQKIRAEKRAQRNSLSKTQQHINAQKIYYFIQKTPAFKRAKNIAFYLNSDGEVSLNLLIRYAQKVGKHCFLPCIEKKSAKKLFTFNQDAKFLEKKSMVFRRYTSKIKLVKNIFGIHEPRRNDQGISSDKLDLVIVPLVSFDTKGNRLGMGGGFYDREFNAKQRFVHIKPNLIGVAHHRQMSQCIPHLEWDIPLLYVVTDKGIVRDK